MWTPEDRRLVGAYGAGQALSDDQYRLIEPLIPSVKPGGRPRSTDMRQLLDALFLWCGPAANGAICCSRRPSRPDPRSTATSAPSWKPACGRPCATIWW